METHPKEKNKARRNGIWGNGCNFRWGWPRGRLTEEVTAEQRPGGGERVSQAAIWSRALQAESKGPKVRACLLCSKNRKEASVSEKCVGGR